MKLFPSWKFSRNSIAPNIGETGIKYSEKSETRTLAVARSEAKLSDLSIPQMSLFNCRKFRDLFRFEDELLEGKDLHQGRIHDIFHACMDF